MNVNTRIMIGGFGHFGELSSSDNKLNDDPYMKTLSKRILTAVWANLNI